MADHSAESMQRERTLNNSEANHGISNRFLQPQFLTRIPSDGNRNNAHHHPHSPVAHTGRISFMHPSPDKPHETSTDGETGASASVLRRHHHHQTNSNHEHSFLPHTSSARHLSVIPLQQRASHRAVNAPADNGRNHNEIDDEPLNGDDTHRRHIHGAHQPAVLPVKIHRANVSRSPAPLHHDGLVGQPLRFIFMRHSERVNQVLGPEWFIKAFHTHTYQAYDAHLPMVLPKRRFERAYEFDTPLTVRGLTMAKNTGKMMVTNNLVADLCLSSCALRCIQTSERILKGMERRETIPMRIEPGLFECPHMNRKLPESFMTNKELISNGYHIKSDYQPVVEAIHAPESLPEYFERSANVMRGIVDRYGSQGGTILIVTHAPGLLALTEALRGLRPNAETFYRTVSTYPPLATYLAEYDGTKWKHSERPFSILPAES